MKLDDRPAAEIADDVLRRLRKHQERYVRAWIAATGIHPTQARLVQTVEHTDGGIKIETHIVTDMARGEPDEPGS